MCLHFYCTGFCCASCSVTFQWGLVELKWQMACEAGLPYSWQHLSRTLNSVATLPTWRRASFASQKHLPNGTPYFSGPRKHRYLYGLCYLSYLARHCLFAVLLHRALLWVSALCDCALYRCGCHESSLGTPKCIVYMSVCMCVCRMYSESCEGHSSFLLLHCAARLFFFSPSCHHESNTGHAVHFESMHHVITLTPYFLPAL